MTERLAEDTAAIYKILCNTAETLIVDFTDHKEVRFNQEAAFMDAFDYIEDLYDEGIGEDLSEDQINVLAEIAIANKAWFIFEPIVHHDGRNFGD